MSLPTGHAQPPRRAGIRPRGVWEVRISRSCRNSRGCRNASRLASCVMKDSAPIAPRVAYPSPRTREAIECFPSRREPRSYTKTRCLTVADVLWGSRARHPRSYTSASTACRVRGEAGPRVRIFSCPCRAGVARQGVCTLFSMRRSSQTETYSILHRPSGMVAGSRPKPSRARYYKTINNVRIPLQVVSL